jgi:hypothetical protein
MIIVRYLGQFLIYAGFAVLLGYFSASPAYTHFPPDKALIKLAFAHSAKPKGACHRLTEKELQDLSPNMRRPVVCPRERWPVEVELRIDGAETYAATLPPSGLSGDGPARAYVRIPVASGPHELQVGLRDSGRKTGFDYTWTRTVQLEPRQSLLIDFRAAEGGFSVR